MFSLFTYFQIVLNTSTDNQTHKIYPDAGFTVEFRELVCELAREMPHVEFWKSSILIAYRYYYKLIKFSQLKHLISFIFPNQIFREIVRELNGEYGLWAMQCKYSCTPVGTIRMFFC